MADAVLFAFLHTEMVAEQWTPDPDPGPGGQKRSPSVLGFCVGRALGEVRAEAGCPGQAGRMLAFGEELDALKFLRKDLWVSVFQKQMDGLRTNHQFLAFTCGLLCGALRTLGFQSLVTASMAALPASLKRISC